jgi:hypothetical protein
MKHTTLFTWLTFLNPGEKLQVYFIQNHLKKLILIFEGVSLNIKKIDDPPICPIAFYESLKRSIEKWLFSSGAIDLPSCPKVLDANNWLKM